MQPSFFHINNHAYSLQEYVGDSNKLHTTTGEDGIEADSKTRILTSIPDHLPPKISVNCAWRQTNQYILSLPQGLSGVNENFYTGVPWEKRAAEALFLRHRGHILCTKAMATVCLLS
jgi:hypothetical protein